jgi:hypothetical protein
MAGVVFLPRLWSGLAAEAAHVRGRVEHFGRKLFKVATHVALGPVIENAILDHPVNFHPKRVSDLPEVRLVGVLSAHTHEHAAILAVVGPHLDAVQVNVIPDGIAVAS